uniref:Uncharacterized protein n=1 Tax=Cacopsylla melanoneura TaxID=428564 RepID=A0A8D8X6Z6_9HEMI
MIAIFTLFTAALNSCVVVWLNHVLKFFNQEILLLPRPLLPSIFPCRIFCNSRYRFSFLITWPRYCSLRIFMVFRISFSFFILFMTTSLVTLSFHDIFIQGSLDNY